VNAEPACADGELTVVCGMPGCEITLDGRDRSVTDELGGITFQVEANHEYRVRVTKPGYEPYERKERKLGCGEPYEMKALLAAKPVALRLRTKPAECEIYLDGQKQAKGSDEQGLFSFILAKPTVLVEAHKKGFLTATKNFLLVPELGNREFLLELDPISARVKVKVNIDGARIAVDNQKATRVTSEALLLRPGSHTLAIEALGYAPVKFDLTVGPDESVERSINLERLSLAALQSQALAAFSSRAYDDVLKLCRFIREVDAQNALAYRLSAQVYLERGDYGGAAPEIARALSGGETIALRIRRHAGEKFDKGHNSCSGQLILSKTEMEFRSSDSPADNFKVGYNQIQIGVIKLKNSTAPYLATKVMLTGNKRDYNFYSFDKELSPAGKPYLEMIQNLLHPH